MTGKSVRALTADETGHLIALGSILLGAGLYLYPPLLAGFPVNDGGLFYIMIRAIQQNGFRLPLHVAYNGLDIPFAYPPFGFYVGAALSSLLGLDPLRIIQWFPVIGLIGTSVAFYFMAIRMLESRLEAAIATFLYIYTPRAMTMLVMGGGLTRSLGQLFLILTVTCVYATLTRRRRLDTILAIAFGSLVVLTHPEAAVHTAAASVLLLLFKGRSRQGILDATVVGAGVIAVSAVWWLPTLLQLGISPFASAAQTGLHASILFVYPFMLTFTQEPAMTAIAALGLIGLMAAIAKRAYLLPVWVLLPFAVDARDAATVAVIPLALLGAVAIYEVLYPAIQALQPSSAKSNGAKRGGSPAVWTFAGYTAVFLVVMGMYAAGQLSQLHVSTANREAFSWVAGNTAPESRFLILTGETEVFCDPVQEWFPSLSGRVSKTTIQGYEWSNNGSFFTRIAGLQEMQRCRSADDPIGCVQTAAAGMGIAYDYIYVPELTTTTQMCRPTGEMIPAGALSFALDSDTRYQSVYRSGEVEIFAFRP